MTILPGGIFPSSLALPYDLRNIVAYCFRKAGSMHRDNIRVIDGKDVIDGLHQVRLPAEDRRTFRKRTVPLSTLLFVMPCQRTAVVSAAALRAVALG